MILNRQHLFLSIAILAMAIFIAACVEIPNKAPTVPPAEAEIRFMAIHPTGSSAPASFQMASGPSYSTFTTYTLGGNVTPTEYATFPAGSKKFVYFNGVRNDTLVATFETDQRATIVFGRNAKPITDSTGLVEVGKMFLRFKYEASGLADTALVFFSNYVQRAQDTLDVYADSTTAPAPVINNLRYGFSSASVKVAAGKKRTFFFTDPSNTTRLTKDSVVITGASRKIYNYIVYDKYDSTAASANQNANVKIKLIEHF